MNSLKGKEVNPILLAPVAAVVVLAALYFFWLRPYMEANAALRNFNSPEAQARRDPEQRKMSDSYRDKLKEALAKEGHGLHSSSRRGE